MRTTDERGATRAQGQPGTRETDWLDDIVGLCADCPDFCDILDEVIAERDA